MAAPSNPLAVAPSPRHLVQMHDGDSRALVRNVATFLAEGLRAGEAIAVVASAEHCAAFEAELRRIAPHADHRRWAERSRWLDARETLDRLLVAGRPDAAAFRRTIGALVDELAGAFGAVRAYGEMVGLLWTEGLCDEAIALEGLWNGLLSARPLSLFCGYPIDVFAPAFNLAAVDAVFCSHSDVVSAAYDEGLLRSAIERAMDDVLGGTAAARLRPLMKPNYRPSWSLLPAGEAIALWLRNNLADHADRILERARALYHTEVYGLPLPPAAPNT